MVRHDPARISPVELARVIGEVEAAQGLDTAPVAAASVVDPANSEPLVRELVALATNLGGLGYWATSLAVPLGRIPPLIPALVSVFDPPVLQNHLKINPSTNETLVGGIFARENYGIALPAGSALRKKVNETLLDIIADGTYDDLYTKYSGDTNTG